MPKATKPPVFWGTPTDIQNALQALSTGKGIAGAHVHRLKRDGFVAQVDDTFVLTAKARRVLAAQMASGSATRPPGRESIEPDALKVPDIVDRLANPRKGEALLVESCDIAAARRFQSDVHVAQLTQRVTQSWSLSALNHRGPRRAQAQGLANDSALDAQTRIKRACETIGPEFANLLIDICLFEKTLTTVEAERHWPKRSGKLVIALALKALARHYGLSQTAQGPTSTRVPAASG